MTFWKAAFKDLHDRSRGKDDPSFREFVLGKFVDQLNTFAKEWERQLRTRDGCELGVSLNPKTFSIDLSGNDTYELRSGGERRRSDLAVLFALMDMACYSARFRADFLFLDEAFDSLDKDGRKSIQAILGEWQKKVSKVFVITHSDVTLGLQIAGTIHVSKNPVARVSTRSSASKSQASRS